MFPELKTLKNTQDQQPTVNEGPAAIRPCACVRKKEESYRPWNRCKTPAKCVRSRLYLGHYC